MKDELSDFSGLEDLKNHPVSSQIDDVFKTVIKEKKSMARKETISKVPEHLPSLPDSSEFQLSDGEFSLDLGDKSEEAPGPPSASDDFDLSLSENDNLELGDSSQVEASGAPEFGDLSFDEDLSSDVSEELSDDLSLNEESSEVSLENLGELDFGNDLEESDAPAEDALSLDEIDLGGEDDIPSLDQTREKNIDLVSDESVELLQVGQDQNELSDDAMKKLQEIDEIMVMDASLIDFQNDLTPEKNLDEPLVSEDLDLGSLNFNTEDSVEAAPAKEEKAKKKRKEIEAKEPSREVGEELREISGAYTVEMERLQATLSNLRSDREELLSKIQKFEDEKILQSRQTLSLRAELDEKKIELTIIRKKLNEEISELKDRIKLHDEKRLILDEKNKILTQELEKAAHKNKIDVKKVQLRERELEQKLELLKADAETQIRHRDLKILELKRKIDSMEFDMESISMQEKRSVESRFELEDKLEKAIKTLRTAINVLEDEPDRVDALKALKKSIDM